MKRHYKLGKLPKVVDRRNLQFAKYRTSVPVPPLQRDWIPSGESWPMYGNDTIGDCVVAAALHVIGQATFYTKGVPTEFSTAQAVQVYSAVGGYVPGDPSTDNGLSINAFLKYWKNNGLLGHELLAWVEINPLNLADVEDAINLFGSNFSGVALPVSAQGENCWSVPATGLMGNGTPGSWGGHCVPNMNYNPRVQQLINWGETMYQTQNFFMGYCDELYALITADWVAQNGLAPSGFNLSQLSADLAVL